MSDREQQPESAPSPSVTDAAEALAPPLQDGRDYPDESSSALPRDPPPFEPLFTLLTNVTTNATVHPRVQYLFSDDDTSVLSNAPPAGQRAVVVDLAPSADNARWAVSSTSSLTSDFAITGSRISGPSADGGDAPDSGASAATLRVEGVEREPVDPRSDGSPGGSAGTVAAGREDMVALSDDFRRRMDVLRSVVGEGEKRREASANQQMSLRETRGP
ncbi:uncharacterized protein DCS_06575 [Drechmeria coniospora]|uniref:Uncharacterized protein n=1 Tax=Drechmeria coniospora TaxID=98403 RepID=A0A151GC45_DRECN|nr:uncharacterized protein DCS_06575 [Drechmeria coniospora]KYK54615.1 uncharacterized protein DCS_06575 [Drechmeria coniospora]ODA76161.1 hypothetical protein RJ55_08444 [Drechmeria coniospora]